jgi:hypothetical protein
MAGNSNVTNTFTQDSFNFSFHTNEKSGDQSHFLFQDNGVSAGGDKIFDTLFANDHTFNTVTVIATPDGQHEIFHMNSHVSDFLV